MGGDPTTKPRRRSASLAGEGGFIVGPEVDSSYKKDSAAALWVVLVRAVEATAAAPSGYSGRNGASTPLRKVWTHLMMVWSAAAASSGDRHDEEGQEGRLVVCFMGCTKTIFRKPVYYTYVM